MMSFSWRRRMKLLAGWAAALILLTGCAKLQDAAEIAGREAVEELSGKVSEMLGEEGAEEFAGEQDSAPGQSVGTEEEDVQERGVISGKMSASYTEAANRMEIHFLDVGQGDCILIKSGEHAILIDAGNNGDGEQICSYLREMQVSKLDYCIGTHPHADHIGAMDDVIRNFDIGTVILPDKVHTSQTYEDVLDAIEEKRLEITIASVGDTYDCGDMSFVILGPVGDYGDNLNDWSVGIRLTHGENAAVFTGDAEAGAEGDMCGTGLELEADLWKAGHHGSSTSNSPQMLNAVSPSYTVISCGEGNSYGHPHMETLEAFRERGIQVYRTDEQGTVIAYSDGEQFTFSCEPSTTWKAGTDGD